MTHSFNLTN